MVGGRNFVSSVVFTRCIPLAFSEESIEEDQQWFANNVAKLVAAKQWTASPKHLSGSVTTVRVPPGH